MALKIVDHRENEKRSGFICGRDIPTGTVFSGRVGDGGAEQVFIRAGKHGCAVISLTNPEGYWTEAGNLKIYDYKEVCAALHISYRMERSEGAAQTQDGPSYADLKEELLEARRLLHDYSFRRQDKRDDGWMVVNRAADAYWKKWGHYVPCLEDSKEEEGK